MSLTRNILPCPLRIDFCTKRPSVDFSFKLIDFDRKLFNGLILWVFFAMIPFSAIAWLWTLVFSDSTTTGNTGNSAPTAAPTAALADNGNQTTVLAPPNQTQKVTSISIVV